MSITWGLLNVAPLAVPPVVLLASSLIASSSSRTQRASWMRATPSAASTGSKHAPRRAGSSSVRHLFGAPPTRAQQLGAHRRRAA